MAAFDTAAYQQSVATMLNKDLSDVTVTTSAARRRLSRALQSAEFYVVATVVASSDKDARSMQSTISTSIADGSLATDLGVTAIFAEPVLVATAVYPSPSPPPTPILTITNSTGDALTTDEASGTTLIIIVLVVVVACVLALALGTFMYRQHSKAQTIVELPVTAASVTSAAEPGPVTLAESEVEIGEMSSVEETETKI